MTDNRSETWFVHPPVSSLKLGSSYDVCSLKGQKERCNNPRNVIYRIVKGVEIKVNDHRNCGFMYDLVGDQRQGFESPFFKEWGIGT